MTENLRELKTSFLLGQKWWEPEEEKKKKKHTFIDIFGGCEQKGNIPTDFADTEARSATRPLDMAAYIVTKDLENKKKY